MNSRKELDDGLNRIDPVDEEQLNQIEQGSDLLLKKVLDSDVDPRSSPPDGWTPPPVWRRQGPRLGFGAAVALAGVVTALIVSAGGSNPPKAFAVEPLDGGGVTIKINSPEDAPGLEAALAEAGIRSQVTWLPVGMTCREPHFTPSIVRSAMGGRIGAGMGIVGTGPATMTIGIMTREQYRVLWRKYRRSEISSDEFGDSTGVVNLDPREFRPDQSVVISGAPGPSPADPIIVEGGYEAEFSIAEGPVEPCEPVKAPTGGMLEKMNRALEEDAAERRAEASALGGESSLQGNPNGG